MGVKEMVMERRPDDMVRITTPELAKAFIDEQAKLIQEQVGDKKVLLALSGGVDSSVVAALLIKAIGKNLVCVHVNHGLLRKVFSFNIHPFLNFQFGAMIRYPCPALCLLEDGTDLLKGQLAKATEFENLFIRFIQLM